MEHKSFAHAHIKFEMCLHGIQMEGRVSQNFDIDLSFFLTFRKCTLILKKVQNVTLFVIKYELGPK